MLKRKLRQIIGDSSLEEMSEGETRYFLGWFVPSAVRWARAMEVAVICSLVALAAGAVILINTLNVRAQRTQLVDDRLLTLYCIALVNTPPDSTIHHQVAAVIEAIDKPCPPIPESTSEPKGCCPSNPAQSPQRPSAVRPTPTTTPGAAGPPAAHTRPAPQHSAQPSTAPAAKPATVTVTRPPPRHPKGTSPAPATTASAGPTTTTGTTTGQLLPSLLR